MGDSIAFDDRAGLSESRLACVESRMQGWRDSMEDVTRIEMNPEALPDHAFLAVFDGHVGDQAAIEAANIIVSKVLESAKEYVESMSPSERKEEAAVQLLKQAVHDAHFTTDAAIRDMFVKRWGKDALLPPGTDDPSNQDGSHSGSTAILTVITPTHFIFSSVGDSRHVLARDGFVDTMLDDHKPYSEVETARINKAGGKVTSRRVDGRLAVSRAFADFHFKADTTLAPKDQQISVEPSIRVEERSKGDEFLFMGCDGIWDVMEDFTVCDYIHTEMRAQYTLGKTPTETQEALQAVCEGLLDKCLAKGSRDNMSCLILVLDENALKTRWENIDKQRRVPHSARWVLHWTNEAVVQWARQTGLEMLEPVFAKLKVDGRMLLWCAEENIEATFGITDETLRAKLWEQVCSLIMQNEPTEAGWSKEEVCEWLTAEGYEPLTKIFLDACVTGTLLLSMRQNDLKGIGVKKIGQRKKVWGAIEKLQGKITMEGQAKSQELHEKHVSDRSLVASIADYECDAKGDSKQSSSSCNDEKITDDDREVAPGKDSRTLKKWQLPTPAPSGRNLPARGLVEITAPKLFKTNKAVKPMLSNSDEFAAKEVFGAETTMVPRLSLTKCQELIQQEWGYTFSEKCLNIFLQNMHISIDESTAQSE
jgi:serine/threonine protein phosphatase PrpC